MRAWTAAIAVLLAVSALTGTAPAHGSSLPVAAGAATCSELTDPALCDSDGDGITDVVEQIVCGSATCATGREDTDRDGIPDWSEVIVCGSPTCADPRIDTDGDGIPDFAEVYVCGSEVCSTGREDADADGIADWVEFVICGNRTCANGREDYDGDGVSDAQQLAACVIAFDVTGPGPGAQQVTWWSGWMTPSTVRVETQLIWWPLIVGALLFVAGMLALGAALCAQRRRDREQADADGYGDEDGDATAQLSGLLDAPK